jgi:hypothetical protein
MAMQHTNYPHWPERTSFSFRERFFAKVRRWLARFRKGGVDG